jgi:hypothetical protein
MQLELLTGIPNSTPVLHKPPACNIGFTLPASCLRSSAVKKEMIRLQTPGTRPGQGTTVVQELSPNQSINARSVAHPLGTDCTEPHSIARPECSQQIKQSCTHNIHLPIPHTTQLHIVGVVDISMPHGACLISTVNEWQCSQSATSTGQNRLAWRRDRCR